MLQKKKRFVNGWKDFLKFFWKWILWDFDKIFSKYSHLGTINAL